VFSPDPVREFRGHTNDILDLSWSKGGFLLSASMDKTARLWHLSWPNSLVSFVHGDFVTSACFHPKDDRFFLSGSLDGKLRLWNISAKKVQKSQEVPGLITATAFTKSGKTACVGTFAGAALFYSTDELQYTSSIAVRSPSGKNAKGGRKITAIEPLCGGLANPSLSIAAQPGAGDQGEDSRVVITSNDSRVRAYDVSQKKL
ncbi:WD40 repeat-like protein, partial [Acaromyces ingoldii]